MADSRLLPPQFQLREGNGADKLTGDLSPSGLRTFGEAVGHPAASSLRGRLAEQDHARVVADYIAGMTDRYAIREHRRIFAVEEVPV